MCTIILKIQILKLSNPIKALGERVTSGVTNSRDYRTQAGTTKEQSGPGAPPCSLEILYICLWREASMPIPVRKHLPSGHGSNRVF